MATMIAFAVGTVIGIVIGGIATYFFQRRATYDAKAIAETLSAAVLTKQTEQILQLAETKLSGKKEVIDSSLKAMKSQMDEKLEKVEVLMRDIGKGNVEIDTRLQNAAEVIKDLSTTAHGLKQALNSNEARGQWGERMAEDVLRLSGLIEGINYIKQKKMETTTGRPDFTFLLPQDLKLNMDVKFPFSNYELYITAETKEEKEKYKKQFLKDVRNRVKEVQTRDYISPENNTVDYVLLFIPNEQIFSFINEIDRSLIDDAMKGRTIICSPLSLYAILAVIRQSIDNFSFEAKSKDMLGYFGTFKMQWEKFKEQMTTVKTRLESAQKGYDELIGTRERQLEKPLEKIEELRIESGTPVTKIDEAFKQATEKQLVTSE